MLIDGTTCAPQSVAGGHPSGKSGIEVYISIYITRDLAHDTAKQFGANNTASPGKENPDNGRRCVQGCRYGVESHRTGLTGLEGAWSAAGRFLVLDLPFPFT